MSRVEVREMSTVQSERHPSISARAASRLRPNRLLMGQAGKWGCPDIARLLVGIRAEIDTLYRTSKPQPRARKGKP